MCLTVLLVITAYRSSFGPSPVDVHHRAVLPYSIMRCPFAPHCCLHPAPYLSYASLMACVVLSSCSACAPCGRSSSAPAALNITARPSLLVIAVGPGMLALLVQQLLLLLPSLLVLPCKAHVCMVHGRGVQCCKLTPTCCLVCLVQLAACSNLALEQELLVAALEKHCRLCITCMSLS